jgi:hypothetical protein
VQKKKHTAKGGFAVFFFAMCVDSREALCCVPDKKHMVNYWAHGKLPVVDVVACVVNVIFG